MARLTWQAGIAIAHNEFIEPASILAFGYEATTAGTTGTSEPNWPLVAGNTVADGSVVWTARTATTITWTASPLYKTGAAEPAWPTTIGGTVVDGSITWTTTTPAITDTKCPQSIVAFPAASKVFAPYKDVTRYCATDNPRDWSTQDDAGFLPTGLHSPESPDVTDIDLYRGRLAIFTGSNLQIWTVDPDPAQMALFDTIAGVGTPFVNGSAGVADDLYFLTPLGVRSLSIAAGAQTLQSGDIGAPIDPLVQAKINTGIEGYGTYYPSNAQYWIHFLTEAFVYTKSKIGKIGAWSRYVFPFTRDYTTQLDGKMYIRSGNTLYMLDQTALDDAGTPFEGIVAFPYLDMGEPGTNKMLAGFDIVGTGTCTFSVGYDQNNPLAFTTPFPVGPDTVPGGIVPLPVNAPSMAPRLVYSGGQAWQLNAINQYLVDMRKTS